jgi:hypothetical protein
LNLETVPQRLRKRQADPLLPVLTAIPDLERALSLLSENL